MSSKIIYFAAIANLLFFSNESALANPRAQSFTCSGTSEFATNLLIQSGQGLVNLRKKGVGTLETRTNQIICKLIYEANLWGIMSNESIIYTATMLDDGNIWVEFVRNNAPQRNVVDPSYSIYPPTPAPMGPLPTLPSYTHRAEPRREFYND